MTNLRVPGDVATSVREIFRSHIGEIQAGEKKLASKVKFNPEQVFYDRSSITGFEFQQILFRRLEMPGNSDDQDSSTHRTEVNI